MRNWQHSVHKTKKLDIYVVITITGSISLLWTIGQRGYYAPSSHCFGTDNVYL